jgi:cytochrome c553
MKPKVIVALLLLLGCLVMTFGYNMAFTRSQFPGLDPAGTMVDGIDPPHAVDIDGKVIPESSATQPDKPIILSKDSEDTKWGEMLNPAALFDHSKHNSDVVHSYDGKTVTACVECHHTAQPSAPAGQEYLKKFEAKEILTAATLEKSKEPVKSCRACHFQESSEETDDYPPKGVTYPKKSGKPPSGKLTNFVAYHTNCILCHDVAKARDAKSKAPTGCGDCHVKKS